MTYQTKKKWGFEFKFSKLEQNKMKKFHEQSKLQQKYRNILNNEYMCAKKKLYSADLKIFNSPWVSFLMGRSVLYIQSTFVYICRNYILETVLRNAFFFINKVFNVLVYSKHLMQ